MVYKILTNSLTVSICLMVVLVVGFVIYAFDLRDHYPLIMTSTETPGKSERSPDLSNVVDPEIYLMEEQVEQIKEDQVDAFSYVAFNPVTQQRFVSHNPDEKVPIASLTKLLTAKIALDTWELDDRLVVGGGEFDGLEWTLGLEEGDVMTFEDVLKAMLVSSYNDAAVMVATNYPDGYGSFIDEMNDRANKLGMLGSNFTNPTGLHDDQHYSTANDLAKLVKYILVDRRILEYTNSYTDEVEIERNGEILKVGLLSTNQLLGTDPYIKGLKTGYTKESGPSFIGYYDAGEQNQLVTIVLNADEDRFKTTANLVDLLRASFR